MGRSNFALYIGRLSAVSHDSHPCFFIVQHSKWSVGRNSKKELRARVLRMAKSPEEEHPHKVFGWAATDSSGSLSPFHFSRRYIYMYMLLS